MNVRTESSVLRESWLNIHFDDDYKRDFLGFCIEEGSSGGGSTVPTNNPRTVEPAGTLEDLIKAWEQCVVNPDTEWVAGESCELHLCKKTPVTKDIHTSYTIICNPYNSYNYEASTHQTDNHDRSCSYFLRTRNSHSRSSG